MNKLRLSKLYGHQVLRPESMCVIYAEPLTFKDKCLRFWDDVVIPTLLLAGMILSISIAIASSLVLVQALQ